MKPMHRDDLPMDVVEQIEKELGEKYPGFKVTFVGDRPEGTVPDEVKEQMEKLKEHLEHCMVNGLCQDCGVQMPDWPKPIEEDGKWPEGWCHFTELGSDVPIGFQCPECDKKEQEEDSE